MKSKVSGDHPLRHYLKDMLHETLSDKLMRQDDHDVELYLSDLLLRFLHNDQIFALKDVKGHRLQYVYDMLLEADIRLSANTFEREREVHKHIGDFVLFHAGLFPEWIGSDDHQSRLMDHIRIAKYSYDVVSTFNYGKYADQAPTFQKLSQNFETYATVLRLMRVSFRGFGLEGWLTDMAA